MSASALAGRRLTHRAPRLGLDVEGDRAAAAVQHVELGLAAGQAQIGRLATVDADHLGAHVGEQRGGERRRADACHLDDAKTGERTHRGYLSVSLRARPAHPASLAQCCRSGSDACTVAGKRFSMAVWLHARYRRQR